MTEKKVAQPSAADPALPPPTTHVSPPWSLSVKVIVAVAALLLLVLVIWRFQSLIPTLTMGCILAYLLNPLVNFTTLRFNVTRGGAVAIVYSLLLLLAIGGGIGLGFLAVEQASSLTMELLPDSFTDAATLVQAQIRAFSERTFVIGPYRFSPAMLPNWINLQELAQQAANLLRPVFSQSGSWLAQLAQATVSTLGVIFLVIVVSIYLVKDSPKLWETISNLAHQPGYRQDAERLLVEFTRIWNAYLRGQVILALVIGVIVSVMLSLLGVRYALGLGVLSGVLEFLPIVGPLVGTGSAVLVAFFQSDTIWGLQSYQYALLIAAVMGVIQGLENNILVPRIVGDALDLHPLLVMISVIMGASLAGILGAVLAAPVVATIKLVGSYAWRKMLDLPPFSEPAPAPIAASPGRVWTRWLGLRSRLSKTDSNGVNKAPKTMSKAPPAAHPTSLPEPRERQKRSKAKR